MAFAELQALGRPRVAELNRQLLGVIDNSVAILVVPVACLGHRKRGIAENRHAVLAALDAIAAIVLAVLGIRVRLAIAVVI
jgi:hypothetical protein